MGRCLRNTRAAQLSGRLEAGGALPQWCVVDEVSKRSATHRMQAGQAGVWWTRVWEAGEGRATSWVGSGGPLRMKQLQARKANACRESKRLQGGSSKRTSCKVWIWRLATRHV